MGRKSNQARKEKQSIDLPTPLRSIDRSPQPEAEPKSTKQQMVMFMATGLVRTLGIILLIVSMGAFFQIVPLTLVFVGGYLGVQPNATYTEMDTIIWAISSVAFIVPMVWAFIKWVKYIWARFIIHPISLIPSRLAK